MEKKGLFMKALKNLDEIVAAVSLLICVILVNLNIIMRYFFNMPLTWAEEFTTSLFVWTTFIGSAFAYRKHKHLGVDILVKRLPDGARRAVSSVVAVIEVVVLVMLTVISAQYVYHLMFNRSGAWDPVMTDLMRIPKWWTGIAVPIGFGLSVFHAIRFMIHRFRGISADDETAEEEGGVEA